ncbi:hypothetical protein RJ639_010701 [Escallonia herrerae]|uniref:acyl-CoA oxidase n=1 Tax=Escallonia herrerae TaxID=1293975 RepID=A0AA88VLI6_9ASTE|nr:hypothetical protein RJ639_010701 [Escallonia herrerae]
MVWIGNAAVHGKFATVFAKLLLPTQDTKGVADMGVHAFIVPIRDLKTDKTLPGIEINDCGHKVGLNGVDNGALRFRSVRIPRDNLLNRFGDVSRDGKYTSSLPSINKRFAATLGELVGGRVGLGYSSVGVLKIAVTIAIRYSLLRQQFGPPKQPEVSILDYQSHQHKLMPMLASTYAFHFATLHLVEKYSEMKKSHDEQLVGDVHALSAGLKAYVTSFTAKSLSICREACGGHGYAAVNRFGSLRNDHDIFQTFEGDNTVLLQQVAGDLLKQYQQKFQGGTFAVTWNYLRESMNAYLSQPNPVTSRWESEDHLRDPKFQLDAFRYRTSRLLQSAAMRLRKHSKTLGSFGAWNRCLNHLLTLAESHIESVILEKFIEAIKSCPDASARAALKLACDLYALDRIWNDIGTYRNAIHKLTEYLSFQVRNIARELVDAFDLPDHVTRAPIGMQSTVEAYSQYTHSSSSCPTEWCRSYRKVLMASLSSSDGKALIPADQSRQRTIIGGARTLRGENALLPLDRSVGCKMQFCSHPLRASTYDSFLSHAYSLSKVEEWLPAIMQNSSTKSLPLSSLSSFDAVARGFLDEDDRDDVERCQMMTFVTFCGGSTQMLTV